MTVRLQPAAICRPEQYDFFMNENYISAECGFQLQHTVIATVEKQTTLSTAVYIDNSRDLQGLPGPK